MQIKRINIYTGSLLYQSHFALTFDHHILFARDFKNKMGLDLVYQQVYPLLPIKNKGYVIGGFVYSLDSILKQNGYPEIMGDTDIVRLLTDDSKKIFLESNILQNLDMFMDLSYEPILYKNCTDITQQFTKKKSYK